MAGIEDGASQEIEASTSSNSTRNSKKRIFLRSILNDNLVQLENRGTRTVTLGEKIPRLPSLEKKDFIENWLLSHNPENSPEKSCPSPILGVVKRAKISSPILGYKRKRVTRETKENLRINSDDISRFSRDRKISSSPKNESARLNSRFPEFDFSTNLDTTHETTNSSTLNFNTSTSTLNATRVSRRLSWTSPIKKSSKNEKSANFNDYRNRAIKLSKIMTDSNAFEPIEETRMENRSSCSPAKFESVSPSRWAGYRNEILKESQLAKSFSLNSPIVENDAIVIESSSTDDPQENLNINDRSKVSNGNSLHRAKRQKQEQEVESSPLRWNFRRSLLRETAELPETLSLSAPLTETAGIMIESNSTDDPRESLNTDCQSRGSSSSSLLRRKKCNNFESESPLRWSGYGREILATKLQESGSFKSTRNSSFSPGIEKEQLIINSNDAGKNLKFEDLRNFLMRVKKSPTNVESESPLRWNGYGSEISVSILPDTLSLNSPEIENEQMIIEVNATDDFRHSSRIDNRENVSHRIKKSPLKFVPESPQRWTGYRSKILASKSSEALLSNSPQIKSEPMVIESNSLDDPRRKLKTDGQRNFSSRVEKNPSQFDLRIPESSKSLETLSLTSSPIGNERIVIESICTDAMKEISREISEGNLDNQKRALSQKCLLRVGKIPVEIESESPLRWNGYGNEISEMTKILETPPNSPLMKTEKIVNRKDNLSIDKRIGLSYGNSKNILVERNEELPSRWNGLENEISEFSQISETPSNLSLVETKRIVNFGEDLSIGHRTGLSCSKSKNVTLERKEKSPNFTIDPSDELKIDNQSQELEEKFGHDDKKNPLELKPELAQMLKYQKILESRKLSNTVSLSLPLHEHIDVDSYTSDAPEDDLKIESDSDDTISEVIENIVTQNSNILREKSNFLVEASTKHKNTAEKFGQGRTELRANEPCDSDETYCSNGEPVLSRVVRKFQSSPEVISQNISQLTNNSQDAVRVSANKSDICISQASSPLKNNSGLAFCGPTKNTMSYVVRKKKRAKKGTLVAKLQSLVNLQISNLNIWQHQMTLHDFKISRTHFVTLMIRERETHYGRHFLIAAVIEDSHNLLKCFFPLGDDSTILRQETRTITLMIIPEINGKTKIQDRSTIKIYQPWDIVDQRKRVLSTIYFDVTSKKNEINDFPMENVGSNTIEKIIGKFDCPCIQRGTIDDTCKIKFTDTKPSVMQAMFG